MKDVKTNTEEMKINITGDFTARYVMAKGSAPQAAVLLLHGYSQSGEKILGKLKEVIPGNFCVVAPNAPFPIPRPLGDSYEVGFSWYFYESDRDEYYIDMGVATDYLLKFVKQLSLNVPVTKIIGYSQGGYLAPFVAQKIPTVTQVLGLSCEFLEPELHGGLGFTMDAVHGEDDTVVDAKNSQNSFNKLVSRGNKGKFVTVKNADHKISDDIKAAVRSLIL